MNFNTSAVLPIRVQDIDHCGIVAGIIDEMGLVGQINQQLGTHAQEIISAGQVVKAMILNGLGFVSASLYLFEKFFVVNIGFTDWDLQVHDSILTDMTA